MKRFATTQARKRSAVAAMARAAPVFKTHRLILQVNTNDPAAMNLTLNNVTNVTQHYKELGEKVEIDEQQKPKVIGQLADRKELIAKGYYKEKDWNDYRILARGNHLEHYLNGVKVVDVLDNDPKGRSLEGILALQIHAGPPMLVEFKDILLKPL